MDGHPPGGQSQSPASARRRAKMPWLCVQTVISSPFSGRWRSLAPSRRGGEERPGELRREPLADPCGGLPRHGARNGQHLLRLGRPEGQLRSSSSGKEGLAFGPPGGLGQHQPPSPRSGPIRLSPPGTTRHAPGPSPRRAGQRRLAGPAWRPGPGVRSTRPNTMPGSTRSYRKRGRPVTLSGSPAAGRCARRRTTGRVPWRDSVPGRAVEQAGLVQRPVGQAGRAPGCGSRRRAPRAWPRHSPVWPRQRPGRQHGPARTPGAAPRRTPRWTGSPR